MSPRNVAPHSPAGQILCVRLALLTLVHGLFISGLLVLAASAADATIEVRSESPSGGPLFRFWSRSESVVFEGTLTEVRRHQQRNPSVHWIGVQDTLVFSNVRAWKGTVGDTVTVLDHGKQLEPYVGQSFLAFGSRPRGSRHPAWTGQLRPLAPTEFAQAELIAIEILSRNPTLEEFAEEYVGALLERLPSLELTVPEASVPEASALEAPVLEPSAPDASAPDLSAQGSETEAQWRRAEYRSAVEEGVSSLPYVSRARRSEFEECLVREVQDPARTYDVLSTVARAATNESSDLEGWLLDRLEDPLPHVRSRTARVLIQGRRTREEPYRSAVRSLVDDPDVKVARTAIHVYDFTNVPAEDRPFAQNFLYSIVADRDSPLRADAADAMATWMKRLDERTLLLFLRDDDFDVWHPILSELPLTLGDSLSLELLSWLDRPDRHDDAIGRIRTRVCDSPYLRTHLSEWLPRLTSLDASRIVRTQFDLCGELMLPFLDEMPSEVISAALSVSTPRMKTHGREPSLVDWQIRTGLASADPSERTQALTRCPYASEPSLRIRPLVEAFSDPSPEVRRFALDLVGRLGVPWTTSALPYLDALVARDPELESRVQEIRDQLYGTPTGPDGRSTGPRGDTRRSAPH